MQNTEELSAKLPVNIFFCFSFLKCVFQQVERFQITLEFYYTSVFFDYLLIFFFPFFCLFVFCVVFIELKFTSDFVGFKQIS